MVSRWPAGQPGAQSARKPANSKAAKARAAKAAAWGIYGIILSAVVFAVVVPGNATATAAVTMAAVIYFIFWLLGGAMLLRARLGWTRPDT
jgi:hypothetical protein